MKKMNIKNQYHIIQMHTSNNLILIIRLERCDDSHDSRMISSPSQGIAYLEYGLETSLQVNSIASVLHQLWFRGFSRILESSG